MGSRAPRQIMLLTGKRGAAQAEQQPRPRERHGMPEVTYIEFDGTPHQVEVPVGLR